MGKPAPNRIDLTGKTFGRITILGYSRTVNGKCIWHGRCQCGTEKEFSGTTLNTNSNSCGCLRKEISAARMTTHGETRKSKENRAWHLMMQRCGDPNIPRHADYGGRGIRVCERWRDSYECFLSDVGRAPSPSHSMDRFPDVNGNYEPGNVRWATDSEQARNKRDTRWVEFRGKQVCLQEVSEKTGVSPKVILLRMSKGMTADEASSFSARKAKLYDINGEKLNMDQLVLIYGVPKTTFHRYIDASKGDINTAIAKLQEKRKTQ